MTKIHSINAKKKFGRSLGRDSSGIEDDPNYGAYATANVAGVVEDGRKAGEVWRTPSGQWAAKSEKDTRYFSDKKSAENHLDQSNRTVTPLKHSEDPYDLSEPNPDDIIMSKYINKHVDLPPDAEPMGGYDLLGPDDEPEFPAYKDPESYGGIPTKFGKTLSGEEPDFGDDDEDMMTDDPWPYDDDEDVDFPDPPSHRISPDLPDENPVGLPVRDNDLPSELDPTDPEDMPGGEDHDPEFEKWLAQRYGRGGEPTQESDDDIFEPTKYDIDPDFDAWVAKQYAGSKHPGLTKSAVNRPPRKKDELVMTEQEAAYHLNRLKEALIRLKEESPRGWEGTVKSMKKHGSIDNPWALAHWMKNKGWKSHKEAADDTQDDLPADWLQQTRDAVKANLAKAGTTPAKVLKKMKLRKSVDEDEEWEKQRQAARVWAKTDGTYGAKDRKGDTRAFKSAEDAERYSVSEELNERNYRKEYDNYQGTPEQKKRRAQRNKDRRKFEREGKVSKGDGRDIHHRDGNPFNHDGKNTAVISKSKNRSLKERRMMQEERLREAIRGVIKELLVRKTLTPEGKGVFDNPKGDDFFKAIKKGAKQSTAKGMSPQDALAKFNKERLEKQKKDDQVKEGEGSSNQRSTSPAPAERSKDALGNTTIKCPKCGQSFSSRSDYNKHHEYKHMVTHHQNW